MIQHGRSSIREPRERSPSQLRVSLTPDCLLRPKTGVARGSHFQRPFVGEENVASGGPAFTHGFGKYHARELGVLTEMENSGFCVENYEAVTLEIIIDRSIFPRQCLSSK